MDTTARITYHRAEATALRAQAAAHRLMAMAERIHPDNSHAHQLSARRFDGLAQNARELSQAADRKADMIEAGQEVIDFAAVTA